MSGRKNEPSTSSLHAEIANRFGVLPNFFRLAPETPAITANLWEFAKFGYLDNALPSLFKERLFVYLSRFCDVRYCIARHVGFLTGLGKPAGDRQCPPETVEQAVRLIRRPLPRSEALGPHLTLLETCAAPLRQVPEPDTPAEEAIFACVAHVFLQSPQAAPCLEALRRIFGGAMFQHLLLFLAFIRTAHYWTKAHPELTFEDDVEKLLTTHEELARAVLNDPEASVCEATQVLLDELASLRGERALREEMERATQALRQSEERYRAVVESQAEMLCRFRPDGRILFVNGAYARARGAAPEALIGRNFWEFVAEKDRAAVRAMLGRLTPETPEVRIENRFETTDGDRWTLWTNRALTFDADGRLLEAQSAGIDITDRKRAEEALRESEERLRNALDASEVGTWRVDLRTGLDTRDASLNRILGLQACDTIQPVEDFFSRVHPEDRQRADEAWRSAMAAVDPYDVEIRIVRPDGEVRWIRDRGRIVRSIDEQPLYFTGAVADITERKQAEEQVSELLIREGEAREEAEMLNWVSRILAAELDLQKLVQSVTDAGIKLTGAQFGAFFYNAVNEKGESYLLYTLSGAPREAFEKFGIPRNTALFERTFRGSGVVRSDDILKHPKYGKNPPHHGMPHGHLPVRSYLAVPVVSRSGEVLGGLFFGHPEPGVFTERAERIGIGIAAQAAVAIDNASLFAKAEKEITERKNAEDIVRRSEERFRSLISIITDVPWVTDPSGAFVTPQPAWEAYTGQGWEEHRGFGWANALHPEDRERVKEIWNQACESRALYQSEGRLWHAATQQWRYFAAKATPLLNADGSVREWVGACTDVDDQKRNKERLENTVVERTMELQQANAVLLRDIEERKKLEEQLLQAQKMESIGVLAGGIAHDFNNILNIIQGYAFILRANDARDGDKEESLGVIDKSVQRGSALVQQLLTLARRSAVKLELVNVNPLIEGLIGMTSQTFPKTIEFSTSQEPELPPILADPNQITQALLNLCVNARDAMPGGGMLTLTTQVIDGAELQDGGEEKSERYVRIEVKDTGMGMDQAVQSRIFEPFFTTKGTGQGTGLGLSVVYGIVQSHNGTIQVDSAPTRGTTFRIDLPAAPTAEKPAEPEKDPLRNFQTGGRGTVLVVEDEEHVLRLLEQVLTRRGYQVLTASDGEEAIAVYQSHKETIDIVLLDLGLPKIAGRDVLFKIKNENPDVKIVVVSGYLEPEIKSEIEQTGVKHFLYKPYMPDQVVKTFQSLTERE